jgi:tRNA(fMet)-specific endonuclease VapC
MPYYLDTNICSYYTSQKYPQVKVRFKQHAPEDLIIPSIVAAELAAGVENSADLLRDKNRKSLLTLLSTFQVKAWGEAAIWHFGAQKTRLWRTGQMISEIDLLLGCQALADDAVFVTNNTKHFERIEGLKLENWV